MANVVPLIPDEALFFIVDKPYPLNQLIRTLYGGTPSESTVHHFHSVNSHLGSSVRTGQLVILTPEDPTACQHWEGVMMEAARHVDRELAKLSATERDMLALNYGLLSKAAGYSGMMYGWTNTYYDAKVKHVERILTKVEELYVRTYNATGGLRSREFFNQRRALLLQLDTTVNGMLERQLFGYDVAANRIKARLGLSSKAIVHQWKHQGGATSIEGFKSNYAKLMRSARTFSRLGYLSIALDVGSGVANIAEACKVDPESTQCVKTQHTEVGAVAGSVGGGALGGYVGSYVACNLVFGLETAGTSFLWCTIVAGIAGGYAGSQVGKKRGADVGEVLYEKKVFR